MAVIKTPVQRSAELRRYVLLALVAGVPILFARNGYDPINVPKFSFLVVGVSLAAALRLFEISQGESAAGLRHVIVPAGAVAGALVVGWLFAEHHGWTLFGPYPRLTGLVPYLVVALFGILIADAFAGRAISLAWALGAAGGVAGAYALIQFIGLDPFEWSVRGEGSSVIASTLGNPNFVGAFLAMVIPVGALLVFEDPSRRRWSIPLVVLATIGCAVARSEGAWAAAVAGSSVAAGIYLSDRWTKLRLIAFAGAIAIAAGVVGSVAFAAMSGSNTPLPATIERRSEWWQAAGSMATDSPIVGMGPGAFALEHSRYRTLEDAMAVGYDITDDPHSIFLSFLVGAGIIGAAALVVALGWFIRRGLRVSSSNLIGAGFFGAFVAYLVQALISVDTIALRTAMWTAAAGMVASQLPLDVSSRPPRRGKKGRAAERSTPIKNFPVIAIAGVIAIGGSVWGLWFYSADVNALKGHVVLTGGGNFPDGEQHFDKALGLRQETAYRRLYGNDVGALAIGLSEAGEEELALQLVEETREAFAYVEQIPSSTPIVDLAEILERVGAAYEDGPRQALDLYLEARELDPKNPRLVEDTAGVALALEEFELVVDLAEDHPSLHENATLLGRLALAYAHLGEEERARATAEDALALVPVQPEAEDALELLSGS